MLSILKNNNKTQISRNIKNIAKEQNSVKEANVDASLKRINKFLERKDIIDLDNDKIDAIRILALHLEKGTSAERLVDFIKK